MKPRNIPKLHTPKRESAATRGYNAEYTRLRKLYMSNHPFCEWCSNAWAVHCHHKDLDSHNHSLDNFAALCQACHNRYHAKLPRT